MKTWNGVFFSPTGGTRKIIKAVFDGVHMPCKGADLTSPKLRKRLAEKGTSFSSDDVVIFGVPVYSGRVPLIVNPVLDKIKGEDTSAVIIVVYGNRAYDDALLELKDIVEKNGFIVKAAGAFIGEHSYTSEVGANRPDEKDLKLAVEFGQALKSHLEKTGADTKHGQIQIPGSFPYKELRKSDPFAPVTKNFCIQCGICAKRCPGEVIDFEDCKKVDAENCIHCCNCIKICPVNAKVLEDAAVEKIREFLINTCAKDRKEPEFFL